MAAHIRHLALAALCGGALAACAGPGGQRVTPEEYARIESQARESSVQAQASGTRDERTREDALDGRERELVDELADARFELTELVHRRERTALEHTSEEASEAVALARAGLELAHARVGLEHFDAERAPRRREQDALSLTRAKDALQDQREELAQLELMYAGSELGEGTAEIVVERARRAIARAEAAYGLAARASLALLEVELPQERALLVLSLAEKEVAAANAERAQQLGALSRAAALRALDHEAAAADRHLEQLGREQLQLESERRDAERERIGQAFPEGGP